MSLWYAVRTATRQEMKAVRYLDEQGYSAFLPCETVPRRLGGSVESVSRPLFPGYLFILCEDEDFRAILEVEGVHQFVRFGVGENQRPYPFPTQAIIELQAQERSGKFDYTKNKRMSFRPRKGDLIRVTAGTWQGFVGLVLSTPSSKRARIKLEGRFGNTQTLDIAHLAAA